MGDIIHLHPIRKGERIYITCDCTGEEIPMTVIAIHGDPAIVAALFCTECEQEIPVVNGYVELDED